MFKKLLIANRGEIAIRIARSAKALRIPSLAVYSSDDASSLHRQLADAASELPGRGVAAYLNQQQLIAIANTTGCDAIHPGYGFLSENSAFASACQAAGIHFVGPTAELLALFGDKVAARQFAKQQGVAILPGSEGPTTLADAQKFLAAQNAAIVVKAVAGGGGRGMRVVSNATELDLAFARCQSEALNAFGLGDVYLERFIHQARHIEVQIIADRQGNAIHLWERDCTLQRRHQKILEVAPSPFLAESTRHAILNAALQLAKKASYQNLGTFEFLLDPTNQQFYFIEANPRLQVEHTITEEITGVDLVTTQIKLAAGMSLAELGLQTPPRPRGFAIQARINMETMQADGDIKPQGGTLQHFSLPSGPGIRVDSYGYSGYSTNPNFDSLLAKIICTTPSQDWAAAVDKTRQALTEFVCTGVATNREFLWALLQTPDVANWIVHTRWIDSNAASLIEQAKNFCSAVPLLAAGNNNAQQQRALDIAAHQTALYSPLQGTVLQLKATLGAQVYKGQELLVIDSMKMEHVITAPVAGKIVQLHCEPGTTVFEKAPLLVLEPMDVAAPEQQHNLSSDPHYIRPDLQEVFDRHMYGQDSARPDAVAKRRKTGQRTARENIADLVDEGSLIEYGPLVIAAQRARRPLQELMEQTPGDGLIGGLATINATEFGAAASQCAVMTYDYTVFAGTQGQKNHRKKDRLFDMAEKWRLPTIVFAEGGGGRPGESERNSASGLDCLAFWYFAKLKGRCPLIGVVSGRCFAGNAVLLGCSDVIIATENANIGMGGPAMIEGGGLGIFKPEEVGPVSDQRVNGVIDIVVKDEADAVAVAKKYLGYFQGSTGQWHCADQTLLRSVIPENRLRVYEVRKVIELLADTDSVLELRKDFAPGIITSLARIEGKPVGILANNPQHLGGAIDSPGADKAARFLQTCNAFGIPVVYLCDTPGIMVGPEAEKTALVRHAARLFIAGAALQVPFFSVVLRKAYGLGAQAMAGGSFNAPVFTVSWPTGEFGGMGLEGAVKLGYRKEIEAIADPAERDAFFQAKVAAMYQLGKATTVASYFDLDDVIDPAETRHWLVRGLAATLGRHSAQTAASPYTAPPYTASPYIDTW